MDLWIFCVFWVCLNGSFMCCFDSPIFMAIFWPPKTGFANLKLWLEIPLMSVSKPLQDGELYPVVNQHNYGKSPCLMGKSTISMAIFNSYVNLPGRVPFMTGFRGFHCTQLPWVQCWISFRLFVQCGAIKLQVGLSKEVGKQYFRVTDK